MNLKTETVQRLMEVGYVATGYGFLRQAEAIFAGVQAVRSDSEMPAIGLAVAQLNAGLCEVAVKTLENDALGKNPDSELAQSFLGLALRMAGQNARSEQILKKLAESGKNQEAVAMAKSLLESN